MRFTQLNRVPMPYSLPGAAVVGYTNTVRNTDSLFFFIIAPSLRVPNEALFAYRLHGFKDDSVGVFEVEGFAASEAVFTKVEFLGR